MTVFLSLLLFAVGLILIIKGGDAFVEAASRLAQATGIPKFIIGATIVSVATTLPEISVSLMASMHGEREMAIGNAVGSVCCNIGLILGLAIIMKESKIHKMELRSKGMVMFMAAAFLWAFTINGKLSLLESMVLLGIFAYFLFSNIRQSIGHKKEVKTKLSRKQCAIEVSIFIVGAAAIITGAHLLVQNGVVLAGLLGISDRIIGLTMMAIGTSLPELITAMTAVRKNETSLSVGNIFGANTIDITLILASCSGVSGGNLQIAPHTTCIDLPVSMILMAVVLFPGMKSGKLRHWQGILLILIYSVYLGCLIKAG